MEFFVLGHRVLIKYFQLYIDSYGKNYLSTYPHRIRSFFNKTYLKYFSYLLIFFLSDEQRTKALRGVCRREAEFRGGIETFRGLCCAPFFLSDILNSFLKRYISKWQKECYRFNQQC